MTLPTLFSLLRCISGLLGLGILLLLLLALLTFSGFLSQITITPFSDNVVGEITKPDIDEMHGLKDACIQYHVSIPIFSSPLHFVCR